MIHHLRQTTLYQLEWIGTILRQGWTQRYTVGEQQPPPTLQQPQWSTRFSKKITKSGSKVASPTPNMASPGNPPIPPQIRTRKVQVALPKKMNLDYHKNCLTPYCSSNIPILIHLQPQWSYQWCHLQGWYHLQGWFHPRGCNNQWFQGDRHNWWPNADK